MAVTAVHPVLAPLLPLRQRLHAIEAGAEAAQDHDDALAVTPHLFVTL